MSIDLAAPSHDVPFVPLAALLEDAPPSPPVEESPVGKPPSRSVFGLTEMLLKDTARLDRLTRDESQQSWLLPSLLAIGVLGFSLFALILVITLNAAPDNALPGPLAPWRAGHRVASAVALGLAYAFGFTLTIGVCLPSFWFYGLLAGIRASWVQVTAQMVKGQAATTMLLLGILPVYFALALGAVVFRMPPANLRVVLWIGLALPFIAGVWGLRAIYLGFVGLADTMPEERRACRECWLRRLTAACTGCYTAVCPVMIWTLYTHFATQLVAMGL